jgi:hypothetical protein
MKIGNSFLLTLTIMFFHPPHIFPQKVSSGPSQIGSSYREGIDQRTQLIPALETEKEQAQFGVVTSWIPGEGHRGYIRYKIHAFGYGVALGKTEAYINKLHACAFTLNLYDKDKFVLKRIPLVFMRSVSDDGSVIAMDSNDMTQMDLADYKSFLVAGVWTISWTC